jgi:Na+-transporting NADH:ubiquinone oxidoreductase subunit NqrB
MAIGLKRARSRQQILKLQLIALLPVTIAALFNTGYQYLRVLVDNPALESDDIRSRIASGLGASYQEPGVYDMLAAGLAHLLPILGVALITGGIWERIIAEKRQRPFEPGFILIALLFTLLLPGAASFSHVVFGVTRRRHRAGQLSRQRGIAPAVEWAHRLWW